MGRLYAVDMRLRPAGGSGSLAVSLGEFRRYYDGGPAQLWERQALTRARAVVGEPAFAAAVEAAARKAAYGRAYAEAIPGARLVTDQPGQSPIAWQGSQLSRVIAEVAARAG